MGIAIVMRTIVAINAQSGRDLSTPRGIALFRERTRSLPWGLGLPDKTRPEEDYASRQRNPAQEPFSRPIQPAANLTQLREEIVTPFHHLANLAKPGLALAARGGVQAEACRLGPLPGGSIAIGLISGGRG